MARSKKPIDDIEPRGNAGALFINYDLSDSNRATFKRWREQNTNRLEDMLNNLVDAGYQVSLKADKFNDCMGAYLIAKETKTENDGYILCGRSKTVVGALFGVCFRHFVLFDSAWPTHNHRANDLDDD